MLKVSNRRCIRKLSDKSLRAARARNAVAIVAIALTTLLFTALFTIAMTINNSFQQSNFRQAGGSNHASFKDVSEEQMEKLAADPLVKSAGKRLMLGMAQDEPFLKAHVEVSYMDAENAKSGFSMPTEGRLPTEGTNEVATDTRVLSLLGVEPKIGQTLTIPYTLGGNTVTPVPVSGTFTLSGFWEYDPANMASMVITSRSYAEGVLTNYERTEQNDQTGTWTLNVMLNSSLHIREDAERILANCGYANKEQDPENGIAIGVNWSYTGAQIANNFDIGTLLGVAGLLLLIFLTGYLIIYNVFQISVTGDIRFYGLLKTIGTTGKQLKRLIRRQAYVLSCIGIPLGLALGYAAGVGLSPLVMEQLSYKVTHSTANPVIFIGAALFALVTVRISCAKPGRMAARVSPIEAVRYTEGADGAATRKTKKARAGRASLPAMAWANLGRSRKKTALTVLSLSLAVVLLSASYTFARGFDMEKYLEKWVASDFILGHADYFQTGSPGFSTESGVTEQVIQAVDEACGTTAGGRIYGLSGVADTWITEEKFREYRSKYYSPTQIDAAVSAAAHNEQGLLAEFVQLYGMEQYALDQLTLIDGDLSKLSDPSGRYIAANLFTDDYGDPKIDTNDAKVGDKLPVTYVEEFRYVDSRTGEPVTDATPAEFGKLEIVKSHTVEYEVCARVTAKHAMTYRYSSAVGEFILPAHVFTKDSGTSDVMIYLFDVAPENVAKSEAFLQDYTEKVQTVYDFESKQKYVDEFNGFRSMFLILGGALSAIIGLIGVLNFLNAVLTGILARRRELAVLEAVGMTGKQQSQMLVLEGLFYALLSLALSLVLNVAFGFALSDVMGSMFWFFTYRFTLLPLAVVTPLFIVLGVAVPLLCRRAAMRTPVIERIKNED